MLSSEGNLYNNNFEYRNNVYARLNTKNAVTFRSVISQIENIEQGECLGETIHENINIVHINSDTIIACNTPPVSQTTLIPSQIHFDNHSDTQYFSPIAKNVDNRTQFISEPDQFQI